MHTDTLSIFLPVLHRRIWSVEERACPWGGWCKWSLHMLHTSREMLAHMLYDNNIGLDCLAKRCWMALRHMCTCIHVYMHAYIHTHKYTAQAYLKRRGKSLLSREMLNDWEMQTYDWDVSMYVCVCICMCACMLSCMCVCVCMCVYVCVYVCSWLTCDA